MLKIILLLLLISSAYTQEVFEYEAENFEIVDGVIVSTDSCMLFYSQGAIHIPIMNLIGNCNIYMIAKEDHIMPDCVKMEIRTPSSIDTIEVDSTGWKKFLLVRSIETAGAWSFRYLNNVDGRRLYLDKIIIERFPFSGKIVLKWNPNPEQDLAGYKIYFGATSINYTNIIDVGNIVKDTLNLSDGKYYFALTAYDTANNESPYSNELSAVFKTQQDTVIYLKVDLNHDRTVDQKDLFLLLDPWGLTYTGVCILTDINCDGAIDHKDLFVLLDSWGVSY